MVIPAIADGVVAESAFVADGAGIGMPGIPGIRCFVVSCWAAARFATASVPTTPVASTMRRTIDVSCISETDEGLAAHDGMCALSPSSATALDERATES
jgi:hypothetical protein